MIDDQEALVLATQVVSSWGRTGKVECRAIKGGWRCWQVSSANSLGESHVLVRGSDGVTVRCPPGLLDALAEELLWRS